MLDFGVKTGFKSHKLGWGPTLQKKTKQAEKKNYLWNKVQYLETSDLSEFHHQGTRIVFPKCTQMLSVTVSQMMNSLGGQGKWESFCPSRCESGSFQSPSRAARIPPVWGGVYRAQKHSPNGHLWLSWMDPQSADGLRVFPINNTFLSHAISTLNESQWQPLPFLFPWHSLLFLGHHEASTIFNMFHTVAQKLHMKSFRNTGFKEPTRIVYPCIYLNTEISIKVFGNP